MASIVLMFDQSVHYIVGCKHFSVECSKNIIKYLTKLYTNYAICFNILILDKYDKVVVIYNL